MKFYAVVVEEVKKGGPAAKVGLQVGFPTVYSAQCTVCFCVHARPEPGVGGCRLEMSSWKSVP